MTQMTLNTRLGAILAATALTAMALAGCTDTTTTSSSKEPHGDAPAFSGPYAAEYTQAWEESDSQFVRTVIEDEQITDQEWAELESRMASCFQDAGASFDGFTPDGGYGAQKNALSSEQLNTLMGECEKSTGEAWLNYLWFSPQINPDNTPFEELMTACLIRTGVVAADYTVEQYLRDVPTMDFPYLDSKTGRDGFQACNADPTTGE